MDFVSIGFYPFLAVVLVLYYIFPLQHRWYVLLAGSLAFFCLASGSIVTTVLFVGILAATWALGLLLEHGTSQRTLIVALAVLITLLPLLLVKTTSVLRIAAASLGFSSSSILVPVGLSFFTLQIIAYLIDVSRGKIAAQHNPLKYALFVSFFPQILQGPIPRYDQLEPQLVTGHAFDDHSFLHGFMSIIWGFFLKMMIADKAGVAVDVIFAEPETYTGAYVLVGGVLYSIQLYADFLACITLAQGIAEMFGIHLAENFARPYLSTSVREFWGRWHISLSSWLRDYIYIPLGGNRKGCLRRYVNLIITFAVSGLWHGSGLKYLFWGWMHAGYEIAGDVTAGFRDRFWTRAGLLKGSRGRRWIGRCCTFSLVMMAWIVFRADTLQQGLSMLLSMFTVWNPWILVDDSLLNLGLVWKEWAVLIACVLILAKVSVWHEMCQVGEPGLRDRLLAQPSWVRCCICVLAILAIVIFGTYGYGYNAADFIYAGF